jgi:hypothetical protein
MSFNDVSQKDLSFIIDCINYYIDRNDYTDSMIGLRNELINITENRKKEPKIK